MAAPFSPNPMNNPQKWVNQIRKTFESHLQLETELPVCIFKVPETLTSEKPDSYVPQNIGLGPIHHFQTDLYNRHQQLKLTTSKTVLKPYGITSDFDKIVVENLKELVPEARCCYDTYFDVDDDTLAFVFAFDALFLLDVLSKSETSEFFEDAVKVENQIPLVVLIWVQGALKEHSSGDSNHSFLSNLLVRVCETRSPLKFSRRMTRLDLDVTSRFHVLDCMYHLIMNHTLAAKNEFLRANFFDDIRIEDVENVVQMAGELCPGANAFLQPLMLVFKLPWEKITNFVRKMLGENPSVLEIDIPSAQELSRIGKIEFCMTPGGIREVEFDDETCIFYLPILSLKPGSEVILRNLVAYEGLMFENRNVNNLEFTEYVDLMCGIIDGVRDVRILRDKHIVEGELGDEEIVKIFDGISKSRLKTDETSELCKVVARVNRHFGSMPRVKAYRLVKKHFVTSWKVFAIVFTLLNVLLLIFQGVCQVYGCSGRFGVGGVQLVIGHVTESNQFVDF